VLRKDKFRIVGLQAQINYISCVMGCIVICVFCCYQYAFIGCCLMTNRQPTEKQNRYQLLCIYSIPPDDVLQICPKRVEVE
jgi:hypothetical protein